MVSPKGKVMISSKRHHKPVLWVLANLGTAELVPGSICARATYIVGKTAFRHIFDFTNSVKNSSTPAGNSVGLPTYASLEEDL
jgi:hypothetical protein